MKDLNQTVNEKIFQINLEKILPPTFVTKQFVNRKGESIQPTTKFLVYHNEMNRGDHFA